MPFYSPDFTYHIDIDRRRQRFQIRDTITNKVVKHIPKDIMTFDNQMRPLDTINRIQWIDNRLIRLVNRDGIEKILDFQEEFITIATNRIPLFTTVAQEGFEVVPYYYEQTPYEWHETEKWLARKYQKYKSAYNLLGKKDFLSLYEEMFTVHR